MKALLYRFLAWLHTQIFIEEPIAPPVPPQPAPEPTKPVEPTKPAPVIPKQNSKVMLDKFCTAIMNFEGGPGDLNHINNNPGNFRCSPVGYMPKYGNVKCRGGFAVFPTFDLGWQYLQAMVHYRATMHPHWTILDFFMNYAPPSDHNPTHAYANNVAHACGVPVTTTLKELFG